MSACWKEEGEGEIVYLLYMFCNTGGYSGWTDRGYIRSGTNK